MAEIRPFEAIRPRRDLTSRIAALPYDVYNREEARQAVKGDGYSFLRLDRPETQFGEDQDMYAPEVYEKAKEMYGEMKAKGEFVRDGRPCYYIYELIMDGRGQSGLVAVSSVDDYINGVIKRHENTRKEKEQDRINHVDVMSAQTGPIFLAYPADEEMGKITAEIKKGTPDADFTSEDGITHRIWVISEDETIKRITEIFASIPATYIADGHHRAASAAAVSRMRREAHGDYTGNEEFNYFLSVLFPSDELKIMDYNRVIRDAGELTASAMLEKLEEKYEVKEWNDGPFRPRKKGEAGFYTEGKWYALTARPEFMTDDPVEGLDVAFLQREILSPVFGISDPGTDPKIEFVGGIRGLKELEKRCAEGARAAFAMYPMDIDELFAVADAGRLMPPKSTWFEPKLRSGLFIHEIEK